jgi:hypothetical protein
MEGDNEMQPVRKYVRLSVSAVMWAGALLAAFAAVAFSAARLYQSATLVADGVRTEGVVIRNDTVRCGEDDTETCFRPVVRFTTPGGQAVVFGAHWSGRPKSHEAGDPVSVIYDPEAPDGARIDGFVTLWLMPFLGGVLGLGGIAGLLIFLRINRLSTGAADIEDDGAEQNLPPETVS